MVADCCAAKAYILMALISSSKTLGSYGFVTERGAGVGGIEKHCLGHVSRASYRPATTDFILSSLAQILSNVLMLIG